MPLKSKTFLKIKNGFAEKVETGFYNNTSELFSLKKRMNKRGFF